MGLGQKTLPLRIYAMSARSSPKMSQTWDSKVGFPRDSSGTLTVGCTLPKPKGF